MTQTPQYDEDAQRWTALPELPPCCKGHYREPHPEGATYRRQLYCRLHQDWINPSGHTCELCSAGQWPRASLVRARVEQEKAGSGARSAAGLLMRLALGRQISKADASNIARSVFGQNETQPKDLRRETDVT